MIKLWEKKLTKRDTKCAALENIYDERIVLWEESKYKIGEEKGQSLSS